MRRTRTLSLAVMDNEEVSWLALLSVNNLRPLPNAHCAEMGLRVQRPTSCLSFWIPNTWLEYQEQFSCPQGTIPTKLVPNLTHNFT